MSGERRAVRERSSLLSKAAWSVAFALIAAQCVVGASLLADRYTDFTAVTITGGSMEPALSKGDLAFVDVTAQPAPGDVMTYAGPNDALVTHRVIAVGPDGFQTQGDANDFVDPNLVIAENVVGVVAADVPLLGYGILYLNTGWGRILCFSPLLLLILFAEIRGVIAALREDDDENSSTATQTASV